ncbi:PREDICTED: serine-protein kinase ATM-like [Priapulus caudatus]|uniref:non-specific serine/threonine protein kinase n=1 Tax=Priapulus caudatus TaxID=37621 RepID=A0ABM1EH90_PRICU|nr:PREDICTED: serine-protein kinase ATM-like [Priapulus caudatus]
MFAIHCEILEYVFAEALKCCPEVVTHVAVVTATLVPVVKLSSGSASEKARSLLEMLFVQNASKLADVMASLHPFPDTPDFARLRAVHRKYKYADGVLSLREEIEIFLKASEASAPHSRGEGLQHIGEQLSSRRLELEVLVRECKRNGQQSILVRLICELIAVCRAAGGEEERQAAARCLGSIGVADLFTLVLQARGALQGGRYEPRLLPGSTDSCDHLFYRNATIFHQLSTYLTDSSVEVVTAASSVLKHLLATKSGQDFAALYKDATNDHLFQNLHPFRKRTRVASARIIVPHEATFLATMDIQEVWAPTNSTHADWITNLVCYLIKSTAVTDEMLLLLEPICKAKVEFCELVLPYLVHSILARRCDVHRDVLSRQVRVFFSSHCGAAAPAGGSRPTTPAFTGAASDVPLTMNKHSVRVMLNLLQYLRLQQTHTTCGLAATAWDTNFWLDVDYLQLARAAQYCSAYFTSVLFTEIACYIAADMCASELPLPPPKRAGKATMTQQEVSEISQTFFVSRLDSVGAHAAGAHAVLLEAYRAIGDSDCVYGCVVGRLADPATRITTYEMENKWERALGTYDLLTHQQPAEGSTGIVKALQCAGLDHVLHSYLEQLRAENRMEDDAGLQSVFYGSAWRDLGQWNLDTTHRSQSAEFQQTIYSALQQVADGNEASAAMSLAAGREAVIGQLLHAGLETTRNIYPALSSLQCLNELEQALPVICRAELVGDLLQRWQHSDVYSVADYDFVEPVLSLRCAVLSVLARRRGAANVDLQGALMTSLERLSRLAREAGLLQIAEKNIFRIKQLEQKWQTGELSWNLEEAKIYWARAECDTALCLLKSLVCDLKKATANGSVRRNASLYPKALCLYGDWLASTHSKHPQVIMEDYLEKAVECVERGGAQAAAVALDAYLSLARYADNQYRHVVDYMCSSTYDAKQALLRESREAASMIKTMDRNQNVSSRVLITLEKQSILDQREMSDMLRQKNTFLVKAVNNYLRLLRAGDDHDLRVFRLVSLWFHNANNDDVNALIKDGVGCIKSHKFLALMYQLAARMSTKQQHSSLFQPTLDELIVRTVKDHPHHTLPIILALANSYKDTELFASKTTPGRGRRSKVKENSVVEEDRVLAAKNMLNLLRVRGHGDIIANMEALSDAYISLAYLDASAHKKETQSINIPASQHLLALANLHNVAVPTLELPVDPTCEYKNIVHVVRFAPTFKLAGGLNLPKIITCLSSDGKQRRQLVKARDDLRQDAVMQQVFAIVNRLLQGQQETRKRRLHIRQYKVMPLSQRSGLLEWCEDTIPLGVYLVGDSQRGGGAHHKYRPGDWTASACRRVMLAASGSDKLAAFLDACRHFLPVFRHFFFEGFVEPAIWFERKLAYTRSVATNSIVGYILGLGDRHVQNILVDRNTAELVHIDLGIAFEQGRILPTPETVPFRLTRDIVDGMGITGTEGVFRRCCEKTMEVMRSSQEAIVTILEVLLHDPLYAWNLTPLKACAVQQRKHDESAIAAATTANTDLLDVETAATAAGKAGHGSDADVNKMAERVLLRLRQKLQGVEDGVPLSIEGQVSHLIQEARDPKNLACLFPGWQPYL